MVTSIQLGNIFSEGGKTILGGSSGLDTQSIIDALVKAKQVPATKLQDTIKDNTSKITAFSQLKDIFTRFEDAANFLRNPPGVQNATSNVFAYRTVNVSGSNATGTDYLTATATAGTAVQNYTINQISQLAQAKKQQTGAFTLSSANDQAVYAAAGANQFGAGTITVNGQNITLSDGDSLQTVANKFNAVKSQTGISANILQTASGQFTLIYTATQTGTSSDFDLSNAATVTSDPSGVLAHIGFTTTQDAKNALFKIDNVPVTRESNNIDDLISGVTLNLKQVTTGTTGLSLNVNIVPDTQTVESGITNFVNIYNEFKSFAATQTAINDDGTPKDGAELNNDSTLQTLLSQVSNELTNVVSGLTSGDPNRLSDIGITFEDFPGDDKTPPTKNTLVVDASKLESALSTNFDAVRKVFEFDFNSSSGNVQVFSRTNDINANAFTLNINKTTNTYQATYLKNGTPTTVNLDYTALPNGAVTLTGQDNTDLKGLVLIYSGPDTETSNVTLSQGIGDRFYNLLGNALTDNTGLVDQAIQSLDDSNTRAQKEIDTINTQVETYRQQQLNRFAALDSVISSVNTLLQTLDAQSKAQQSNG